MLYVLNPSGGEIVDPTDPNSPYFDDQLCHDYNSGVAAGDAKCNTVPATPKGNLTSLFSVAPQLGTPPSGYKWVRINMKTNRTADPYFVDQTGTSVPLDTRVCWDGESEQLSPGGAQSTCDANGMQQVYMVTSLAASGQAGGLNGAHKLLRFEVMPQSIRPPGAITMEVGSSANASPVVATFNNGFSPIPATSIDGRVYGLDGLPSQAPACSSVAALAANTAQGTTSLQNSLNSLRLSIVQAANNSCNANGTSIAPNNCTPALAWVRGTATDPRFSTASSPSPTSTPTPTPVPTPLPTPTPVFIPMPIGSHDGHGSDDHQGPPPTPTPTPTPVPTPTPTPTPAPIPSACDVSSTATCYTNLDLTAPQLSSVPLFAGNPGNSGDPLVYQTQSAGVGANENQAVLDYIAAVKASNTNYYEVASTSLAPTYGSLNQPAVVVITDGSLKLASVLTGYGILEVPNDFEINSNLQWTGIVLVRSSAGQFLINTGASGFINGAVMLQAGNQFSLTTSSAGAQPFRVTYSCDAIDFAMGSRPLKVVALGEGSN